jgi:hypothetical protein
VDNATDDEKHAGVIMIDVLDYDRVAGTNFCPIAEIAMPVTWFKSWGMIFTTDTDDLDAYEIAAGRSKTYGLFALMRYSDISSHIVTLMMPHAAAHTADLARAISGLAAEFGLPASVFHIRLHGEDVPPAHRPNPSFAA